MEFLRTDNIKQPGVSTSVSQTNSHYCTYYNKRIKRGQRAWWKKCGQSVVDTASSWQKLIKLIPITHVGDCISQCFIMKIQLNEPQEDAYVGASWDPNKEIEGEFFIREKLHKCLCLLSIVGGRISQ